VLTYAPKAQQAVAFLVRSYNDIDIFVEDTSCTNAYVRLVKRMLGNKHKLNHVFPLGGKKAVINACQADQAPRNRKRIYLIDGDRDLIVGHPKPKLKHLYRLRPYCSENLLLSERAILTIAEEADTSATLDELRTLLNISTFFDQAEKLLLGLFVLYAIAEEVGVEIQTVNFPVVRLLENQTDPQSLSERMIKARMLHVLRSIRTKTTGKRYRRMRQRILKRDSQGKFKAREVISGKTYLLPLAHGLLKRHVGFTDSFDRLKVRLAAHCELTIDPGLMRAIRRSVR
jgi:Protein of unknown function (DUF4435)